MEVLSKPTYPNELQSQSNAPHPFNFSEINGGLTVYP
jgi:hypothetical protein